METTSSNVDSPAKSSADSWIGRVAAGISGLVFLALSAAPATATVYHVDVTASFSVGSMPFPAFSGSFDLDTSAAPIGHYTIDSFPINSSPLNLTLYQAAALSSVDFKVGANVFTGADLANASPPINTSLGVPLPPAALLSGVDLTPGVNTDIDMYFQQGSLSLNVGFVLCLTLSSYSCEQDNEADFFVSDVEQDRAFDTRMTVTALTSPVPEPPALPIMVFGLVALDVLRRQRVREWRSDRPAPWNRISTNA